MSSAGPEQPSQIEGELSVGAQVVALPKGMYRAFVRTAGIIPEGAAPAVTAEPAASDTPLASLAGSLPETPLRAEITAHIRNKGDVAFVDAPWAGRAGEGLSIEAFSVKPLEELLPSEIEYKGLTANG